MSTVERIHVHAVTPEGFRGRQTTTLRAVFWVAESKTARAMMQRMAQDFALHAVDGVLVINLTANRNARGYYEPHYEVAQD